MQFMREETHKGIIPAPDGEYYTKVILDSIRPSSTYVFSVKAMNYDMSGEQEEIKASTMAGIIQLDFFSGKFTNIF